MPAGAQVIIAGHAIGPDHPAFLIAEVAQSHDGSLGLAHTFVDAAADAGADAVKFQTHIAASESTLDEPFRVKFSHQDASRYDYWKRIEFTPDQWAELSDHAQERGLIFLSSPFSLAAVALLEEIGMAAWKVGSGEITSHDLLRALAATGAPVLLSSGMSSFAEIAAAVDIVRNAGAPLAIFQCTTIYPTTLSEVGLNVVDELRRRFGCPVGFSDHSGTIYPGLAALAAGVDMLEVHITLGERMFGPDVPVSLTPERFRILRDARDAFLAMDRHPVDNDAMAERLAPMRALFTRSVAPAQSLSRGTTITAEMLTAKKPGTGIPVGDLRSLVGRRLARDVTAERLLRPEDLE